MIEIVFFFLRVSKPQSFCSFFVTPMASQIKIAGRWLWEYQTRVLKRAHVLKTRYKKHYTEQISRAVYAYVCENARVRVLIYFTPQKG